MKILILAAGRGERLLPLTRNTPKPLLDMGNGATLLETQIQSLRSSGVVDEVALVTGYLAEQIDAKLATRPEDGMRVRTVFNPFYGVSNNLMSLWLAKHEMTEDFLVTNGDNLFTPDVYADFVRQAAAEGVSLAIGPKTDFDFDDMKVRLAGSCIDAVSKEIAGEEASAESPGLALVRGDKARALFVEHLEALARVPASLGAYWLEIFNRLAARGVPVLPWSFDARQKWQEVDFHVDVDKVKGLLRRTASLLDPGSRT